MGRWTAKEKFLVFWSLATNTNPLKFYKESLYFLLKGRRALASLRQMSDSDIGIFFYMSLYRNKGKNTWSQWRRNNWTFHWQLVLKLSGATCITSFWVFTKKMTSFFVPSPFPSKSWSLPVRLGMCLFVFLFSSSGTIKLNWILLRNN